MAKEIAIMGRLMYIFVPAFIYAVFNISAIVKNNRGAKMLLYLFLALMYLAFQKDILSIKTVYSDPMLAPYKTILSQSVEAS